MQEEEAPAGRQGAERDLGGSAAGAQEPNDAPDSRAWDLWGTSPPPGGTAEQASGGEVVEDASTADPWSTGASEVADGIGAPGWDDQLPDDWRETIREMVENEQQWQSATGQAEPLEPEAAAPLSPEAVSMPIDKIVDPVPTDQVEPLEPEVATPPLNLADQIDPNWPVLEELNSRELMEVQDVLGDPSRLSDPQVFEDLNPHQIQAVMQALAGHVSTPETGVVDEPAPTDQAEATAPLNLGLDGTYITTEPLPEDVFTPEQTIGELPAEDDPVITDCFPDPHIESK